MRFRIVIASCAFTALSSLTPLAGAQSNAVPGMDFRSGDYGPLTRVGRLGAFPNGEIAVSGTTTVCNAGTESIAWTAPMSEDHPLFGFMVVREDADRLIQISDYSYIKHPFAAINSTACSPCSGSGFGLRPGCSDTYGSGTNASRFWLGPPDEINPWTGEWTALGSLFDGIPVDGIRDYNGSEPNDVNHRVRIQDSDLTVNGSRFFYAMNVLQEGEAANVRENNMGYREFTLAVNGGNYAFADVGGGLLTEGSVLENWTGATVVTADNVPNDGFVHVAYKVTPNGGGFRYEFALHNQDNNRRVGKVTIPRSSSSNISNPSFHDVDQDGSNDWTMTLTPTAVVFETTNNPIAWNTIYNFGFTADAAPTAAPIDLEQFFPGPGADTISTMVMTPGGEGSGAFCFGDGGVSPGCTDCPCGNNFVNAPGGCTNGSGRSGTLAKSGAASVANDSLHFDFGGGNDLSFVLLASANNQLPQMGPCPPGSGILGMPGLDGLRCIGGNLIRHGTRATDSSGDATSGWGPPDAPLNGIAMQGGFSAGQTRNFQCFYREDNSLVCQTGQNTSNGVSATFTP